MFIQCPVCQNLFPIGQAQLDAAQDLLRCGRCDTVFNNPRGLTAPCNEADPAPIEPLRPLPLQAQVTTPISPAQHFELPQPSPDLELQFNTMEQEIADLPNAKRPAARVRPRQAAPSRAPRYAWFLGILLLSLLLGGQLAWTNHHELLLHPQGRTVLNALCRLAGCQIPPGHAPQWISLHSREISSHSEEPGVLLVSLTLGNDTAVPLALPRIELRFFDAAQQPLAQRVFAPSEYLGPRPAGPSHIPAGGRQHVQMELLDPGAESTGFSFDFF